MYKSDFQIFKSVGSKSMLETQQGAESVAAIGNTILNLIEERKKHKGEMNKVEEAKINHQFNTNADDKYISDIQKEIAHLNQFILNNSNNAQINIDSQVIDKSELTNVYKHTQDPSPIKDRKALCNHLFKQHDGLIVKIAKEKQKHNVDKESQNSKDLTMVKIELDRELRRMDKMYEYIYNSIGVQKNAQGNVRFTYVLHEDVKIVEKLSDEVKMLLKRLASSSLRGIGGVLTDKAGDGKYVVTLNYKTQAEIDAACGNDAGLMFITKNVDIIMSTMENGLRNPQGRWVFEDIVPNSEIRTSDTRDVLTKIHKKFHTIAWEIMCFYITHYGCDTTVWNGVIPDILEDHIHLAVEHYVKHGLKSGTGQLDPHVSWVLSNDIFIQKVDELRIIGEHNTFQSINNTGRQFHDINEVIMWNTVEIAGKYHRKITSNAFPYNASALIEFSKEFTNNYTEPWSTLDCHTRIGSSMDSYICTEIINPIKNP